MFMCLNKYLLTLTFHNKNLSLPVVLRPLDYFLYFTVELIHCAYIVCLKEDKKNSHYVPSSLCNTTPCLFYPAFIDGDISCKVMYGIICHSLLVQVISKLWYEFPYRILSCTSVKNCKKLSYCLVYVCIFNF